MRLTDDELTALLAEHYPVQGAMGLCWHEDHEVMPPWPCETWRLATEVRDLRAVRDAAEHLSLAREKHFVASCAHDGFHPEISEAYQLIQDAENEIDEALARYEEGGRS